MKKKARKATPKKRRSAKRSTKRSTKRTAAKRSKRSAKRSSSPRRKRRRNMTTKAADRRYQRKSRRARKSNPTRRRKKNFTPSQAGRRLAKKRWTRRDNPLGLRLGNPTGNWGNIAALSASAFGGFMVAQVVDRWVATRGGGKHPDAFTGSDAIVQINAPPDGMRLAAQAGLAVLFAVGGFWAAKKGHDTVAYASTGAAIGAAVHVGAQLWNDSVVPAFAKKSDDPKNPNFFGDRIYPDLNKEVLDKMAEVAKAARADGHRTLGQPQAAAAQRPAPSRAPAVAQGPQGQPRVVNRPAATVGCGADFANQAVIAQLQQQNKLLQDQIAAIRASAVSDGPEMRREPVAAPVAAPPAASSHAPDATNHNVSLISQRLARFA